MNTSERETQRVPRPGWPFAWIGSWMLLLLAWANPWHGLAGELFRVVTFASTGFLAIVLCFVAELLPRPRALLRVLATAQLVILGLAVADLAQGLALTQSVSAVAGWPLLGAALAGVGSKGLTARTLMIFPRPPHVVARALLTALACVAAFVIGDLGSDEIARSRTYASIRTVRELASLIEQAAAGGPQTRDGDPAPDAATLAEVRALAIEDGWGREFCIVQHDHGYLIASAGADGRAGPPPRQGSPSSLIEDAEQDLFFSGGGWDTYPLGDCVRWIGGRARRWPRASPAVNCADFLAASPLAITHPELYYAGAAETPASP